MFNKIELGKLNTVVQLIFVKEERVRKKRGLPVSSSVPRPSNETLETVKIDQQSDIFT